MAGQPEQSQPKVLTKVVAHKHDGTLVKGYLEAPEPTLDSLFARAHEPFPDHLSLRDPGDTKNQKVSIGDLKAVFFVKEFEGNKQYNEVKIFSNIPLIQGIWVQVRFKDGEYLEGVVHNSIQHLVEKGFFMKPPDPESNNEMVYVLKSSVTEYRVLGVRASY